MIEVSTSCLARVKDLAAKQLRLPVDSELIGYDDDLRNLGLTSFSTTRLLLALEREFGVIIPPPLLTNSTFRSVRSIAVAITECVP